MTDRENLISLLKRRGFEKMPPHFPMTPDLNRRFHEYCEQTGYPMPKPAYAVIPWSGVKEPRDESFWKQFYTQKFNAGTSFSLYGVAYEPHPNCFHMTKMYHPLESMTTLEELTAYPYPEYIEGPTEEQLRAVKEAHDAGQFAMGEMQCTVWEAAWYARGMEVLMMDMMEEPELAAFVLDKTTENSVINAVNFAKAGADAIYLGDDIGMQSTPMMSRTLYRTFLMPRLKRVIDAARAINPDIIVLYHSCGHVTPFIDDLIEAGVDVLNPIQPESMDFPAVLEQYRGRISFCGTIGTQRVMPFGTPEDVAETVKRHLDMAGETGGLWVTPTHVLEPEVPIENIVAYIEACENYK